jgi:hypothetical protein
MSSKSDRSQGTAPTPKNPRRLPTPQPRSAPAIRREVQRELDALNRKFGQPKPGRERVTQDYRKG